MMSIISDSHKLVEGLKKKDFSKKQAEGIKEAFDEVDFSQFVTKEYLNMKLVNLKSEIYKMMFVQSAVQIVLIVTLIKLL